MTDCLPSQAARSWQLISILKLKQVLHSYLSRQRKQFILFHPLLHVWKMFLSIFFSSVTSSSDKTAPILLAFLFWCLNPLTLLLLTIGTHLLPCWACSLLKHSCSQAEPHSQDFILDFHHISNHCISALLLSLTKLNPGLTNLFLIRAAL